jgi:hypothetical protein
MQINSRPNEISINAIPCGKIDRAGGERETTAFESEPHQLLPSNPYGALSIALLGNWRSMHERYLDPANT